MSYVTRIVRTLFRFLPDSNYAAAMGVARSGGGHRDPVRRLADLDNFVGRWVAVKDDRVIAVAGSSRALVYELRKLGPSATGAVSQYVAPPSASAMVGLG